MMENSTVQDLPPQVQHVPPLPRSAVGRAFTVHNSQIIAKYACKTLKQLFELSYVNQAFQETMKEYHTIHQVVYKYCCFDGENAWPEDDEEPDLFFDPPFQNSCCDLESSFDKLQGILVKVALTRIPWYFKELTLKRQQETQEYSKVVRQCLLDLPPMATTAVSFSHRRLPLFLLQKSAISAALLMFTKKDKS